MGIDAGVAAQRDGALSRYRGPCKRTVLTSRQPLALSHTEHAFSIQRPRSAR
jgi:hypothetical protein